MNQTLLTVHYAIAGDPTRLRSQMSMAAPAIAGVPGLAFKLWGFDAVNRVGTSTYLFDSEEAAQHFANGPVIEGLKASPDVAEVFLAVAPVDHDLSAVTGAGPLLARLQAA